MEILPKRLKTAKKMGRIFMSLKSGILAKISSRESVHCMKEIFSIEISNQRTFSSMQKESPKSVI